MKFLEDVMYKLYEIYRRMYDEYREACQAKMLRNGLKMRLLQQTWTEKIVKEVEIHLISGKEKVQGAAISIEIMLTVLWDMKRPITSNFL